MAPLLLRSIIMTAAANYQPRAQRRRSGSRSHLDSEPEDSGYQGTDAHQLSLSH